MLFLVSYKTGVSTSRLSQTRFQETGGAPPPHSVEKIAAYHYLDGSGGCAIAVTDDPIALARWANEWTDVISLDIRPVLTDLEMGEVLAGPVAGLPEPKWNSEVKDSDACQPVREQKMGGVIVFCKGSCGTKTCGQLQSRRRGTKHWKDDDGSAYDSKYEYQCTCF